jgi:flavin reductase (DIM6/NTAB) family NADH-FMN oxidoreductase RutF
MSAVHSGAFREALSRFASGVVVVTCHGREGPVGFTVSAFSSLSLDPPLVLVCVGKTASAYDAVTAAATFGVSILEAKQAAIATQFARQGVDRFAGVSLRGGPRVPLIDASLAGLDCDRHAIHDAGDHVILVGRVVEAHFADGEPLIHYARTFGGFAR